MDRDGLKWLCFIIGLCIVLIVNDKRSESRYEALKKHVTKENNSSTLTLLDDPTLYNLSPGDTIPE